MPSDEPKGLSKEMKYDLTQFISKLPLQEAQRKGITNLVTVMINSSNTKMEAKIYKILDKKIEKLWKIFSGVIIGVVVGLILYFLPTKS